MQRQCAQCSASFEITDEDLAFYDKVSPVFDGKKFLIPPPTLCPDCRHRQRFLFRNEEKLYRRTCSVTNEEMISCYSAEKPLIVCNREHWLTLDNTEYGRDIDFSRPFFEQFAQLYAATPKANVMQAGEIINSEYAHFVGWLKNCYLLFDSGKNEDCYYCYTNTAYCKDCCDGFRLIRCELCYDSVSLTDCYQLFHSQFSKNCSSSAWLRDCIGCKHCLGCANLQNREYCILNEAVSKDVFEKTWNDIFAGTPEAIREFQEEWNVFSLTQPHRNLHNIDAKGCTGDYLVSCENVYDSYDCGETKDSRYCQNTENNTQYCYDISTFGESMEYCYALSSCGGALGRSSISNCAFGVYIYYGGHNVYYSMNCHDNCKFLFGCCDLRGKQYCVFNKQYTKEQYEELVPKIIEHMQNTGEWGEFFPVSLSPFGYNETPAQSYYPLTKEEALALGWKWKDPEDDIPNIEKTISALRLPDSIDDIPNDILNWAITCEETKRPFKIIKQELELYRRMHLPIPHLHPDERHRRRMARRNPRKLWSRKCDKCQKEIQTTYAPDRPEIVYCEECYLKEVY